MSNKDYSQLYQSIFNRVHASEELLNKVKNTSQIKTKKKVNFKTLSLVAACLVVVILGTTIINSFIGGGNTFVLKAYAAEIGSDSLVKIATVFPTAGSSETVIDGDNKTITMGSISPFPVVCNGKNVKTIKYTIKNAVFLFPYNSYAEDYRNTYPDAAALSDKIYGKVKAKQNGAGAVENTEQYVSYTLDYTDQADLEKYTDLQTFPVQIATSISTDDDISDRVSDILKNYISVTHTSDEVNSADSFSDEEDMTKLMEAFQIIYDEMYSKIRITVEVSYEDGTTEIEALKLGCQTVNEKDGIVIGAEIVENK